MKAFDHLLGFVFAIFLSFAFLFSAGPYLIRLANQPEGLQQINDARTISLNYIYNGNQYILLQLATQNGRAFKKRFYVPDNEHKNLSNFLKDSKVIATTDLKTILPLRLDGSDLKMFSSIKIKSNKNEIEKLVINERYVVGSKTSVLRKVFLYFLGIISFLFGTLLTVLIVLVIITYRKTGELPRTPDKVEGLKFILRGFKLKDSKGQ